MRRRDFLALVAAAAVGCTSDGTPAPGPSTRPPGVPDPDIGRLDAAIAQERFLIALAETIPGVTALVANHVEHLNALTRQLDARLGDTSPSATAVPTATPSVVHSRKALIAAERDAAISGRDAAGRWVDPALAALAVSVAGSHAGHASLLANTR